jgi:hypothetical protein
LRGARERWRMCGVVRPRRRLPLRPFPCPRPVDRFATGRRCPERVACEMRRTPSVALAAAGVISGRTSASGRKYVSRSRRLIRSPGRLRAEGCGWDGRGVVSTVRGSARHGGGQGAAARRHREQQQQLSTWCTGRDGEAAGDERAAGRRRRTSARDPSTRAALHGTWWRGCWWHRRLQQCRRRREALVPSARCGGGERRAGGGGHRRATQVQGPPSTRYRIECLACVPPPPSQQGGSPTRRDVQVCVDKRSLEPY